MLERGLSYGTYSITMSSDSARLIERPLARKDPSMSLLEAIPEAKR